MGNRLGIIAHPSKGVAAAAGPTTKCLQSTHTTQYKRLSEIFIKVPHMLESYLCASPSRGPALKALRLVSRDLASTAITGVRSCVVMLGEAVSPKLHQIIPLLSHAVLQCMDLCIIIRAGLSALSASHQLAACTLQAHALITGMGDAIKHVTRLHVTVRLVWHNKPCLIRTSEDALQDENPPSMYKIGSSSTHTKDAHMACQLLHKIQRKDSFSQGLMAVSAAVIGIVSSAFPSLQHLGLGGRCTDESLHTFVACCPHLHSLYLEASSVPRTVLQELSTHLPKLTHLEIVKRGARGHDLQVFVDAAFPALSVCACLTSLKLDLGPQVSLDIAHKTWQLLPHSLRELHTTCVLNASITNSDMLQSLQRRTLMRLPEDDLMLYLLSVPNLQALSVLSSTAVVFKSGHLNLHGPPIDLPRALRMRKHLSTLQISCPTMLLRGSGEEVQETLVWLLPLLITSHLVIQITTTTSAGFLQDVARVFPKLAYLALIAPVALQPLAAGLREACLEPLIRCKVLKTLILRAHIPFTTSGFVRLCFGIPQLSKVKFRTYQRLDQKKVSRQLYEKKPPCVLEWYA